MVGRRFVLPAFGAPLTPIRFSVLAWGMRANGVSVDEGVQTGFLDEEFFGDMLRRGLATAPYWA
jgi:hypothetical protein